MPIDYSSLVPGQSISDRSYVLDADAVRETTLTTLPSFQELISGRAMPGALTQLKISRGEAAADAAGGSVGS